MQQFKHTHKKHTFALRAVSFIESFQKQREGTTKPEGVTPDDAMRGGVHC